MTTVIVFFSYLAVFFISLFLTGVFFGILKTLAKKYSFANLVYSHLHFSARAWIVGISMYSIDVFIQNTPQLFTFSSSLLSKVFQTILVCSSAWMLVSILKIWEDQGILKIDDLVDGAQKIRSVRTRLVVIRVLLVIIISLTALVWSLIIFLPSLSNFGTTIFASAGVVSVILGLAAQSTLGNLISGLQLAFSGTVRIGDTVKINVDYGEVETITMTYVIIKLWDERRTVVPCSYFTSNEFENWSISSEEVLGTINLDMTWQTSIEDLRKAFFVILDTEPTWDHKTGKIHIATATNGWVRVQAIVSAKSIKELRALQNSVRERMVEWVQKNQPTSPPKTPGLVPLFEDSQKIDAGAN